MTRTLQAIAVLLALSWRIVEAQAPAGDQFVDRVSLSGPSGLVGASTIDATSEPDEPKHHGQAALRSVWWTWTAPSSGLVRWHTSGSDFDPRLGVYVGSAIDSLTFVASNDNLDDRSDESDVTFSVTSGTSYQIVLDAVLGPGESTLVWSMVPSPAPDNDAFSARTVISGDSGVLVASNINSTEEPQDPSFGVGSSGATVWWSWTPENSGLASLQTSFSNFDTLLGAFTGGSLETLEEIQSDDDGGPGSTSFVLAAVTAGQEYQIGVAGFGSRTGTIVLRWNLLTNACTDPNAAAEPFPAPDSSVGLSKPELTWQHITTRALKVIYGNDDRLDLHEVEDEDLVRVWESTVALVSLHDLDENPDGTFSLPDNTYGSEFGLCDDEPFFDQPAPAWCSGFLVGTDLVATAGHCVDADECSGVVFVFGFRMLDKDTPVLDFDPSQIYFCDEVVANVESEDGADWSLVRLDREVPDHMPLRIRREEKIPDSQSVLVIGHPSGLPAKIAGGAQVRENEENTFFVANLDTYAGNSGSAVINATDFTVEGILVRGELDFVPEGNCQKSRVCPDDGCSGEDVTRTTEFASLVPAVPSSRSYDVFFGPCGAMELVATVTTPSWTPETDLEPDIDYCWQVVTTDECGSTTGPEWRFTVELGALFERGDLNVDELLDITDAFLLLRFMFLGDELPQDCEKSADIDDSGAIDTTDPILLLTHLFLGGFTPPAPFGACGFDPSPDLLGCEPHPGCE